MTSATSVRTATFVGATAVLMWGLLALLTTLSGQVPPFLLAALAFGTATLFVTVKWLVRREDIRAHLHQPLGAWALGVCGLFGYHFFYFMALRNAPPVEAGLIAYMWPLLIVLFSALLPGERLRWHHLAGALAGLAGAVLLITRGEGLDGFKPEFTLGFVMATCCAFTWSGYSVLNRRFNQVPTDAVGGFCAATAVLAAIAHLLFETTVWPADMGEWAAVAGLGLLPVGLAFFTWDYGTKHGDIRVLGALSYAAPLISTVLLIAFGKGQATWAVAAGCVLIIGGAVLAAREMLFGRQA
ncbi:MAG: DMT family transporter [Rhodospirillaceae bacterium]|nr:DMT family transporter [Rhodospirillaceae bacterium]